MIRFGQSKTDSRRRVLEYGINFFANHTSEICKEEWGFWFLQNVGKYPLDYTVNKSVPLQS